ncbi:fructose-bisphosphatase class II family protein [Magnetovibrio sp.]|uniref:fructose-bisphosphatase class II family protein n=1 Tax=Magnetovibrio sp. TaxID=2024836 RepID=UPI002F9387F2
MSLAVSGCDDQLFVYALCRVTEAAARAAAGLVGRGNRGQSTQTAIEAMRTELNKLALSGRVVIGEDCDASNETGLPTGLELKCGKPGEPRFDVVVDPIEGTSYLARGMTNAMAVTALAPEGSLFDPGPAFYMEKFAAPAKARGKIDPAAPTQVKLGQLSTILDKPVSELTVFVLEKPRHRELVNQIHNAGARVALYPAGDVAGALMAAMPGFGAKSGIDALMGTGGTREGMLSAVAIRALGGEFMMRIDPQLTTEKAAVSKAGLNTTAWMGVNDLVKSDNVHFTATGITTGLLFEGVQREGDMERTQSLLLSGSGKDGACRRRQLLTTWHNLEPRV